MQNCKGNTYHKKNFNVTDILVEKNHYPSIKRDKIKNRQPKMLVRTRGK